MSFIDYSGQVILDVALTDEGRARLARADGSFRFAKFAVGDTPINYALYNPADSRGEAYYDIDILATPVFEALTDNAIAMSSKLISINKTNLLYLPVLELNTIFEDSCKVHPILGMHVVCVDQDTVDEFVSCGISGFMSGISDAGSYIRLDQGLDTTVISAANILDSDLLETQYLIEIDNRFGSICDRGMIQASPNSIDDDNIAGYFLTLGANIKYVLKNNVTLPNLSTEVIRGSRGTYLQFKIKTSVDLNSTTALFTRLGSTATTDANFYGISGFGRGYQFIDAIIKVYGGTLGGTVSVPVRFVKLT